jgi:hypothetical protein
MAVVLGVSVSACSFVGLYDKSTAGCTLESVEGDLVEQWGRTALSNSRWLSQSLDGPLVWPDGWSLRTVDGGGLEVVNPAGEVRARTGERIAVSAVSDNGSPMVTLGGLLVCPRDPFRD